MNQDILYFRIMSVLSSCHYRWSRWR